MKPFWRRRREARQRLPWHAIPDDPENADRQHQARAKMRVFDRLGPQTREAAQRSRFDALDVDRVNRRYGCATDFAEPRVDEQLAREVRGVDDSHSGSFGPRFATGI